MEELLKTFTVPDKTKMEEHSIVVDGGAIIGNHSDMGFGVIADSIIAGERVRINGNAIGTEEVRIDLWSHVAGDVRTKNDAYIGEFVNIDGKLVVGGDLDIGKDVKIDGGFEAKGWIVVRNPIPVIIYIFLYLTELLRMGKDEEVEKALDDLFPDDTSELDGEKLLVIPSGSKIDLETIKVPEKARIGSYCRMLGNIRAASMVMGNSNTLFGSIKTAGEIVIGEDNIIHGNIITRDSVRIGRGTHILGEINGGRITVHEEARVDGAMRATSGVMISSFEEEKETVTGGLLDLAPIPAAGKETKVAAAKEKTARKYAIPEKRTITAVRLSDMEPAVKKKKPPAKKVGTKNKVAAKETVAGKKAATKKTAAKKKVASEETGTRKKTSAKKTTTKKPAAKKKATGTKKKAGVKKTTAKKKTSEK